MTPFYTTSIGFKNVSILVSRVNVILASNLTGRFTNAKSTKNLKGILYTISAFVIGLNLVILIRKNIFACLFSVHNTISLSRHEQVCMFNEATFREILLPSSGNVNGYVAHI